MPVHYFFDSAFIRRTRNMETVLGKVKKQEENPLFREDYFSNPPRLWEPRYDNGYPNVCYDAEEKIYRCYYTLIVRDPASEEMPLEKRRGIQYYSKPGRVTAVAYAQSADGIHWDKPELSLVEFNGSKKNNILRMYAHGTSVLYDRQEKDPDKRYKMMTRDDHFPNALCVAYSKDGIHFGSYIRLSLSDKILGDTHNFTYFDERIQSYVLITRTFNRSIRLVSRCTSQDFIHWSEPVQIFRGNDRQDQTYSMPVFQYDGLYFGLPSIYHGGDMDDPLYDKVECELVYSGDGECYNRMAAGKGFIPLGVGEYPDGDYDCGCIYSSIPVEREDELWFYYMGGNGQHTNFRETSLNLARIQKDRLAGLKVKDESKEGMVITNKLYLDGSEIFLTADVEEGGFIKARLLDAEGREEIEGYGFEDFDIITKGSRDFNFSFQGHGVESIYQEYVLELCLKKAVVYKIAGEVTVHPYHKY